MKKTLTYLVLFITLFTNAQNVIQLNNNEYSVNIPRNPTEELTLLHHKDDGMKTEANLKEGTYEILIRPEVKLTFNLNKDKLIDGTITSEAKGNILTAIVKNSKLMSLKGYKNKKLFLTGKINHKDSIASTIEYYDNRKVKKEEKEFFTAKHYNKKHITTYNKDGSYTIDDQLNETQNHFDAKGNKIEKNEDSKDVAVAEVVVDKKEEKVYRIFPFAYKNKWGLVDTNGNEILAPTYYAPDYIGNYDLIVFRDYKKKETKVYSTKTGKELSHYGTYKQIVKINNKPYAFFVKNNESILVNINTEDKITLQLKYKEFINLNLSRYRKGNSSYKEQNYIVGVLQNNDCILLKNNIDLPMAIKGRYKDIGIFYGNYDKNEVILNEMGVYLKNAKNHTKIYNRELNFLIGLTIKEDVTPNQKNVINSKVKIINASLESIVYPIAVLESTEADEEIELPNNIAFPKQFSVDTTKKEIYYINKSGEKLKAKISSLYNYKMLQFGDSNYAFIDESYINNEILLYPKKYLND